MAVWHIPPHVERLWNASPAMLKALKALADAYAECNGEDHPAYVAARAAILKAEGE